MSRFFPAFLSILLSATAASGQDLLQARLLAEGAPALVRAARTSGDARRGAIVFHQPFLACSKCHSVGQSAGALPGPDLTRLEPQATAESLIESVLDPSKVIRKGYEPIVVQLTNGTTVTGLFAGETEEKLVLRDVARPGETISLEKSQIEERQIGKTSIMPAGQVNVLADRQQFLDLARYLIEITEGGVERARQLQPAPSLVTYVLPDYEKQIDHAGIVKNLDDKAFQRGEAIYNRLCVNCHGTKQQAGSLPTSLRFAEGKFKNGSDPFKMYQTLTHGFGLMVPQTWMVPQQKYDVIHYIRETYLKHDNPTQYVQVDGSYLASLPPGTTRGPAPSNIDPWSSMNYGMSLMATYEVGGDGSNFAQKGLAVRLDPGSGGIARGQHWQVFDHDTLRWAAAWSRSQSPRQPQETANFIDWHGINFDGRHQVHPHVVGQVVFANPTGPGWGDPETGSFEDPRLLGRDNRRYGPLPRGWGRFRGVYHHGDQVITSYDVGTTNILEMPGVVAREQTGANGKASALAPQSAIFTRTFHIGSRSRPMNLKVATLPAGNARLDLRPASPSAQDQTGDASMIAILKPGPLLINSAPATSLDGKQSIAIERAGDFDFTSQDFTIAARIKTRSGGTILCQAPIAGPWAPDGKTFFVRGGRLGYDIGWVGAVTGKVGIADDRWHDVAVTWQHESGTVRLFVDGKLDGQGRLKPKNRPERQTVRLAYTSPDFPDPTFFSGQLSEVRFLQTRVSDEQIATIGQINGEPLLAHWKLETLAETIRDHTGRGHDGKLSIHSDRSKSPTGDDQGHGIAAGLAPTPAGTKWTQDRSGSLILQIPAGNEPLKFVLSVMSLPQGEGYAAGYSALTNQAPLDLTSLTHGGPRRWTEELQTDVVTGPDQGPFAVDILSTPTNNPWFAQLRLTGFDFHADGDRMAICSWDGDVWQVSGLIENPPEGRKLKWRRIASGLFQPLGLKIVRDQIFVTCRDQIAILRDLNDDGEADFIECFNNDHQVTEHFHEFAMGLQSDDEGNLYYAKSGRHALPAVVPHHGTLLKVSKDGSRTEILATGFRAANGVCLNPDGTFVVTDQEGFWNPKNRVNWVVPAGPGERPRFYGNLFGYHDVTDPSDSAMEPPLCWITNAFDRSPAELLWVNSDKWGSLKGSLLNLSYGYGKIFVVPFEKVPLAGDEASSAGRVQGGMCELPLPVFPTGIMRGRFHPIDGQLYTCGMFAWAGNATQPGGFYRVRATGRSVHVPIELHAKKARMQIRFSGELKKESVTEPGRFVVKTWSLKRSADYGSKHYDEKTLEISSAKLWDDQQTVILEMPDLQPTWCMSIDYKLEGSKGEIVNGSIHNTIHALGE